MNRSALALGWGPKVTAGPKNHGDLVQLPSDYAKLPWYYAIGREDADKFSAI